MKHGLQGRTRNPRKSPKKVVPRAPHTGLLPKKGPSGSLFFLLSKSRYTDSAIAATIGKVGSAEADCQEALLPLTPIVKAITVLT